MKHNRKRMPGKLLSSVHHRRPLHRTLIRSQCRHCRQRHQADRRRMANDAPETDSDPDPGQLLHWQDSKRHQHLELMSPSHAFELCRCIAYLPPSRCRCNSERSANLNRYRGLLSGDDIPRTTEIILSFDDNFDEFSRKLKQLSKEWEASGLREMAH